jgi:hypothetical protein
MFRDLIRKGAMWSSQTDITNWFRGESDQVGKGRQDWNCGKGKAGKGWLQRVNRVRICGKGMVENGWRGRVGWKICKHVLYLDVDGRVSTCKWSSIHPTCKWSSIHPTCKWSTIHPTCKWSTIHPTPRASGQPSIPRASGHPSIPRELQFLCVLRK